MNSSYHPSNDKLFMNRALAATIHLGLVVLLLFWCFKIGRPFMETIVWGIIIAVATHPSYSRLQSALGGHSKLAATLISLLALVLLIVPAVMLASSLVETAQGLSAELRDGTLDVPPPPESIRSWPAIGEPLYKFWTLASNNLQAALSKITPQLKALGSWLLSAAAGAGVGMVKFVFSIIIAGVLLAHAEGGRQRPGPEEPRAVQQALDVEPGEVGVVRPPEGGADRRDHDRYEAPWLDRSPGQVDLRPPQSTCRC